jgi:hypothetical protein
VVKEEKRTKEDGEAGEDFGLMVNKIIVYKNVGQLLWRRMI